MSIPEFKSEEWFHIARGDVAVVKATQECYRQDLMKLYKHVIIDGKQYEAKGIESFCIPVIRVGATFAILVGEK